jgi:ATP-dependent Lhr-like helicase
MHDGAVEATRYPRNPLDIVAQQVVAMTAMDAWSVDDLFATLRRAAPFADLSRTVFDGVLDMLSGRYPSDEFAELRPRVTWDRLGGTIAAREGAKRVAVANGGTIPDRGLFGVFLLGAGPGAARVGELDEEMVFESRVGETFVLGASTWRIAEITHDRVLVSPAPGEPGKMPFWKGDRAGRPLELGLAIGRLMREMLRLPPQAALDRLVERHDLQAGAAENLLQYLRDQLGAAGAVPDAHTIVVERVRDELGDWRVCVLSPRGGRIHAPWAMAAAASIREQTGVDVETLWGDDGFVVRFPDVDRPPDPALLMPDPDEVQALVVRQLGATALFAAKFRENAARSLLLPKRRPGMRAPLWQQRKRAADLLAVAARYGSFPVLLETYRECLRDFFDMPALVSTLRDVRSRTIRVATVDSDRPSPFAASLLYSYVASFIYDGDAPLAERRAQALAVDQAQLRELVGDAELRELLDPDSLADLERELQRLDLRLRARSADGLHDLLLSLGDLDAGEIAARAASEAVAASADELVAARRAIRARIGGALRYFAVEDAARFRDALGVPLPIGLPESLLTPVRDPLADLALRYARTHGPFTAAGFAARYGLSAAAAEAILVRLASDGRLLDGEFRPGGAGREFIDPGVLRMLRRRSLARLRHEIEPVDQPVLARFLSTWHGIARRRTGPDALLDVIEQLQGAPLPASILETDILPARIESYDGADLDTLVAAGEVVWLGVEPIGERDGRVALYLADHLPRLAPPLAAPSQKKAAATDSVEPSEREQAILGYLRTHGASFFAPLHAAAGGGYPAETVDALWSLVWRGLAANDTMHALRAYTRSRAPERRHRRREPSPFRSRRLIPPAAEGRWSLAGRTEGKGAKAATEWAAAVAQQLLTRYGVVTREVTTTENVPGGFGAIYPVLRAMEESGRIRRGYFVAGLGAAQFAMPGAVDMLRSLRERSNDPENEGPTAVVLAATDPANPYGAALKWPAFAASNSSAAQARQARFAASNSSAAPARQARSTASGGSAASTQRANAAGGGDDERSGLRGPTRSVGTTVVLVDGELAAYLSRGDRQLLTWLPEAEPQRSRVARGLARALIDRARGGGESPRGMLIQEIDGSQPATHPLLPYLVDAGFVSGAMGMAPDPRRKVGDGEM